MFDDLRDLYQEVIFDHNRNPRNFREMDDADRRIDGFNPLCGDRMTLFLKLKDHKVSDASFQGQGCAISTASASIMTEMVKGLSEEEAHALFKKFHSLVTTDEEVALDTLGKMAVLAGVREYPARVKCATLPWHTLDAALAGQEEPVTTE